MKKIYFCFILTLISAISYSQKHTWKIDTINKKETVITNVLYHKVVYNRFYNDIIAVPKGIQCDSFFLMTENGKISKDLSPCYYRWAPDSIGVGMIFACNVVNKDTFILGTSRYYVKKLPDPIPMIANSTGGTISKFSLAKSDNMFAVSLDLDPAYLFDIDSFKICAYRDTTIIFNKEYNTHTFDMEYRFANETFDKDFSNFCLTLKTGDKVLFTHIIAKGFDGTIRNLKPMEFTIE